MVYSQDVSYPRKVALVTFSIISAFLSAGLIFGFQALRPILINDGVFHYLCGDGYMGDPPFSDTCIAQLLKLQLMFTLASTATNISAFPIGVILDSMGPKVTYFFGFILFVGGNLLFGLYYFIPGFILIGVGGPMMVIPTMNVSMAFPERRGLFLAALNGAFDSSSMVYLFFQFLHREYPIHITNYFLVYAGLSFVFGGITLILLPTTSFGTVSKPDTTNESSSEATPLLEESSTLIADPLHGRPGESTLDILKRQLKSPLFYGISISTMLLMLRMNLYISSVKEQLLDKSGTLSTEFLVEFFNFALPLGAIAAIPFIGHLLDNYDYATSFSVLWVAVTIFNVLGLLPNSDIQIVSMCLFAVLRALVYSASNDFCVKTFGFQTFGFVFGIVYALGGAFNLLQYPLIDLALNTMNGHFWLVNTILACAFVLWGAFPIYLYKRKSRE